MFFSHLTFDCFVSLREGGFYLSRCGVATWTRDPGVFWEAPQTPGQPNQCPWPKICPHSYGEPIRTLSIHYSTDAFWLFMHKKQVVN